MSLEAALQRLWYGPRWKSLPLRPLGWLFRAVTGLRSALYRAGGLRVHHLHVPVVVVGNITVGGTGKTPVAAWLAAQLALRGHRVGVVLRGYGGRQRGLRVVTPDCDAAEVGDEALLHARRRPHVVVVGADRVAAARLAVERGAELIVCDDGLQHLRLARDCEIAVVDAARGLGNGLCLPAGPLREPGSRLETVHAVVFTRREAATASPLVVHAPLTVTAHLRLGEAVNLLTGERRPIEAFRGRELHAVAGIGHPAAFFAGLRARGLEIVEHEPGDHASLDREDLPFPAGATVLMTEKDAVKCRSFAGGDWWFADLEVGVEREAASTLLAMVLERAGLVGAGVKLG
jgi:tetraacyldisaccharide 4'-kinase